MVKVAEVTAHAIVFPVSHSFSATMQVMELQPILVVIQADLAVRGGCHEVQEVPEVVHLVYQRENQDHQRKVKFDGGDV